MRRSFRNRSAGAPRSGSDRKFTFRSSRSVLSPPRYGNNLPRVAAVLSDARRSRPSGAIGKAARAKRSRIVGPYDRTSGVSRLGRAIPEGISARFRLRTVCPGYVAPCVDVSGSGRIREWRQNEPTAATIAPEESFPCSAGLPVDWSDMSRRRPFSSGGGNIPGRVFCGSR